MTTADLSTPVTTYADHVLGRVAEVARKPGQSLNVWEQVLLSSALSILEARGLGPEVRAAIDEVARRYGVDPGDETGNVSDGV